MTLSGTIRDGVVVFDVHPSVPDGTKVEVIVPESPRPSLADTLLKFAGTVNDLPTDMAKQHDHYLHGTPRK